MASSLFQSNPYQRSKIDEGKETEFVSSGSIHEKKLKVKKKLQSSPQATAGSSLEPDEGKKKKKEKRKRNDAAVAEPEEESSKSVEEKANKKRNKKSGDELGSTVGSQGKENASSNNADSEQAKLEENEQEERTVFVGNLPISVKKKTLTQEFSKIGEVQSVRIRSIPLAESKLPRRAAVLSGKTLETGQTCNAYVVFKSRDSIKPALALNMSLFLGRHIRVDRSTAKAKEAGASAKYDSSRTLFVGNLPFDAEEEEILALFAGEAAEGAQPGSEGAVEAVRVVRDKESRKGRGIAFVLFKTKNAMKDALLQRELKLRDRTLRLKRVQREETEGTKKGGKAASPAEGAASRISRKKGEGPSDGKAAPWEGLRAKKSAKKGPAVGDRKPFSGQSQRGRESKSSTPSGKQGSRPSPKAKAYKRPAVAARKKAALTKKAQA